MRLPEGTKTNTGCPQKSLAFCPLNVAQGEGHTIVGSLFWGVSHQGGTRVMDSDWSVPWIQVWEEANALEELLASGRDGYAAICSRILAGE